MIASFIKYRLCSNECNALLLTGGQEVVREMVDNDVMRTQKITREVSPFIWFIDVVCMSHVTSGCRKREIEGIALGASFLFLPRCIF